MKQFYYVFLYLVRGKGNNAIKIISLTLGLVVGLVLFSKVAFELSFDKFYPDKERIYQLQVKWDIKNGSSSEGSIINAPFAPAMFNEFEEVVAGTTIDGWTENISFNTGDEKIISGELLSVDSLFFKTERFKKQ